MKIQMLNTTITLLSVTLAEKHGLNEEFDKWFFDPTQLFVGYVKYLYQTNSDYEYLESWSNNVSNFL